MAEYKCDHCGMGVSGMNCVKCEKELVHDHLKCTQCGDLVDVHLADDQFKSIVKTKFKFDVDDVEMTVIGTCSKHAKK